MREKPEPPTLLTLEARDNVMLEVMKSYFELDHADMRREILSALDETVALLKQKDIDYLRLKSALTPQPGRRECAFVFDTLKISATWYGLRVFERLMPLLDIRSSHSIRTGDLLDGSVSQEWLHSQLNRRLRQARSLDFQHSTQFYLVYVNNLSDGMVERVHRGLSAWQAYSGFIDFTFQSRLKAYVSSMLPVLCIKHRKYAIGGHPDDVDATANENETGYPYEDFGLTLRSVPDSFFGLFLSYKIERPVWAGFEVDTEFALSAVHEIPSALEALPVRVEPRKYEYLRSNKGGTLKRLGMAGVSGNQVQSLIRAKLAANYIYNLRYLPEHDVSLFDMVVEHQPERGTPIRTVVGLEYRSPEEGLRLITLY